MKTFLTWLESEETPGLSEPQHKKGEDTQELDKTVEHRIRSMIEELKSKGSEEKILASMVKYAEKMGVKGSSKEPSQQQVQQPQTQQPDAAGQMMGQPQGQVQGPGVA